MTEATPTTAVVKSGSPRITAYAEKVTPWPAEDAEVVQMTGNEFLAVRDGDLTKFKGKWIQVEAYFSGVGVSFYSRGQYIVQTHLFSDLEKFKTISVAMTAGERPWEKVQSQNPLTIRFLVLPGSSFLCEGQIVKSDGQPTPSVTVDELVAEFDADPAALSKKLHGNQLIVTGKFAGYGPPPHKAGEGEKESDWVRLDGSDSHRMYCFGFGEQFGGFDQGEEITLIGAPFVFEDKPFDHFGFDATNNLTPFNRKK